MFLNAGVSQWSSMTVHLVGISFITSLPPGEVGGLHASDPCNFVADYGWNRQSMTMETVPQQLGKER